MQPLILTNAFLRPRGTRTSNGVTVCEKTNVYACVEEMVGVIRGALGATPLLLPTSFDEGSVHHLLRQIDGIMLPGAVSNIHPLTYGDVPSAENQIFDASHDKTDLFLIKKAREMNIPFFGICRSMQAMNVAFGGTLKQRLENMGVDHACSYPCDGHIDAPEFMHDVFIEDGGLFSRLFTEQTLTINSMHEQAIDKVGDGLRVEARAKDGVIEALSLPEASSFFAAFQWHPEAMPENRISQALFSHFREAVYRHFEERGGEPND